MLSANTIYKIIVAECEQIHVGDVVMAWDDSEIGSFKVGIFKGYDHTKYGGMYPFLVKAGDMTLSYAYVKRVPNRLVNECNIKPEPEQIIERPINYEEGA